MSVSFEVMTSNRAPARFISRACFAPINNVVTPHEFNILGQTVHSIRYLPFVNKQFNAVDNMYIEVQEINTEMTWAIAERWWKFLMEQPFITSGMRNTRKPSTLRGYQDGFTVAADQRADKMMLQLFLLRAPQYQTGIVNTWDHLVQKMGVAEDTAFVIAFGINNQTNRSYTGERSASKKKRMLTVCAENPSENSIVHGEYFTVTGAKMMLNRLLGDESDARLYNGKQKRFNDKNCYDRARPSSPESLSRFFCKKPAATRNNKNFAMYMINDVIEKSAVNTYEGIGYLPQTPRVLSKDNILTIAAMLEE